MASKIAIIGQPNTGKSFSRNYITRHNEWVVLMPSVKKSYLKGADGKPAARLQIHYKEKPQQTTQELAQGKNKNEKGILLELLTLDKMPDVLTTSGQVVLTKSIEMADLYLKFVSKHMPHVKQVSLPDFTHYISKIMASPEFMKMNSGGQAFQRFWTLASDLLNTFFLGLDDLREDLLVVTEFHSDFDDIEQKYHIFTPGGKMLTEKFLPDSYFDYILYTRVLSKDQVATESERYQFVTNNVGNYPARMSALFPEDYIQNNLEVVVDKVRADLGI